MARFLEKTYCVRKCKKMDIENLIIVALNEFSGDRFLSTNAVTRQCERLQFGNREESLFDFVFQIGEKVNELAKRR